MRPRTRRQGRGGAGWAAGTEALPNRDWHTLDASAVERTLGTGRHGLSDAEAGRRFATYGPNVLEQAPPPSALAIFLHQFASPLIYILLVAAGVTTLLGHYIDASVIAVVLLLNAVIGFVQERQAEASVRSLMKLLVPRAHLIRNGEDRDLPSRELVPGDLVLLESGARVPADVRLVAARHLRIDESLLTGESLPVQKTSARVEAEASVMDRRNMAFMGTSVTTGRGRGYVVAVGSGTELGAIADEIRHETRAVPPLQARITRFAHIVAVAVAASAVLAFILGVAIGRGWAEMFLIAVALSVAAIPEGLPVAFTITLARGVHRMARRKAIVRRLPAVETLGSTSVIGSDKTGTLTENRMTVQEIWADGRAWPVPGAHADGRAEEGATPAAGSPLHFTLLAGVLANEASVLPVGGEFEAQGDPTEVALLRAAWRFGLDPEEVRRAHTVQAEIPFESERQYSAVYVRRGDEHRVFLKGAPERVVGMCRAMQRDTGPGALDADSVLDAAHAMADRGLRVLAMAYRIMTGAPPDVEHPPAPEDLVFAGLQGMMDPPREGVREAIRGCREAGIRVLMITGDHAATAQSIGRQLALSTAGTPVLTGTELTRLDDERLDARVGEIAVYARVAPEQKLRIVHALQRRGEIVAVTGDGVNDAPALKAAQIGIAMGRSGTDVAREAADMVLADDNFVSIYAAVEEGRITFDNVRNVTFFLISTGAAAILTILAALALDWPMPFVPAQLLWLNLVTNGLQDVALAFEPGEPGVARRPPRSPREGLLSLLLWERTLIAGAVMALGTLYLFHRTHELTGSLVQAQTVALTTMVLFQNFHIGNSRSEFVSAFRKSPFSNPFLFASAAAALLIHVGALHFGPTQFVLRVEPIDATSWPRIVPVAASVLAVVELHKLLRRRTQPVADRRD
jgi:magnesium-transporting ATPase (P-type)